MFRSLFLSLAAVVAVLCCLQPLDACDRAFELRSAGGHCVDDGVVFELADEPAVVETYEVPTVSVRRLQVANVARVQSNLRFRATGNHHSPSNQFLLRSGGGSRTVFRASTAGSRNLVLNSSGNSRKGAKLKAKRL